VRSHDLNRLLDDPGSSRNGINPLKISFPVAPAARGLGVTKPDDADDSRHHCNGTLPMNIKDTHVNYQLKSLHESTGLTPWLFPATQDQPAFADHVCVKTVTKQVGDKQRPGDVPMTGRSKDVDALVLPGGKWTPHDLRRTAATTMAELGALPDVVEKCLNHTEVGKVKRIYQRAQYEGPMREAWKLLGSRLALLQDMAAGRVPNVVPLQRSR
jgi:hypothetical protein